jgi:hypothetical protein
MNEQAIWRLAGDGGMAALTIDRLAQETGCDVLELNSLYPEPAFMILVLFEDIHTRALQTSSISGSSTHDRLTDLVMAHLDFCLDYRGTIRRLWLDLLAMPLTMLTLRPYLLKMVAHILKECGLKNDDLFAPIRLRAYFALFLYVMYVWIYDDSSQQEKTLVVLDRGLKKLEDLSW